MFKVFIDENKTTFIGIPENGNMEIQMKEDPYLHIGCHKDNIEYTIYDINVDIDKRIFDYFNMDFHKYLTLTSNNKSKYAEIFVNDISILFDEIRYICIEKEPFTHKMLRIIDNDYEVGGTDIDLNTNSFVHIYLDSEEKIHIDIK